MANFRRCRKFKSRVPQLKVDAGLPVGTYVFQLEVDDQNNNRSKAARVKVKIVEARAHPCHRAPGDTQTD